MQAFGCMYTHVYPCNNNELFSLSDYWHSDPSRHSVSPFSTRSSCHNTILFLSKGIWGIRNLATCWYNSSVHAYNIMQFLRYSHVPRFLPVYAFHHHYRKGLVASKWSGILSKCLCMVFGVDAFIWSFNTQESHFFAFRTTWKQWEPSITSVLARPFSIVIIGTWLVGQSLFNTT